MNNNILTIKVYSGLRWFFYSICFLLYCLIIAILFKYGISKPRLIEAGKVFFVVTLITIFFIYAHESFEIRYNQTFFSYRSSFQRHYRDISYSQIERLWIEFERKPFQALDTLKVRLKDGRIIKITRTAFPQPAYRNFEQMLQERTGLKIKGHSPLVAKP